MNDYVKRNIEYLLFIVLIMLFLSIVWKYWYSNNEQEIINNLQQRCENYNFSNDISIIQQATFFNQYKIKGIYLKNFTNETFICQSFIEMCQPLNIQEVNINRTLYLCFDTSIITQEIKIK